MVLAPWISALQPEVELFFYPHEHKGNVLVLVDVVGNEHSSKFSYNLSHCCIGKWMETMSLLFDLGSVLDRIDMEMNEGTM